jgi:signal transduction histidine kinase
MITEGFHRHFADRSRSALLAAGAVALTVITWLLGWLPPMERATGDLLLRVSTSDGSSEVPVVAVLIDDRAVERYGRLPWPRHRLADLVETLSESGARGFAIDLILDDATVEESDRVLAQALATNPRILAAAFDQDGIWLLPVAELGGVAVAAHAYGEVGPDGVVRTVAATKQGQGLSLPALSLAAARILRPEIAIEAGLELRPEFRPSPQSLPKLSAVDVLDGLFEPSEVEGRVVFIGISATGAGDQFVVPTGPRHEPVPGVLAHASATVSIFRGRLLEVVAPGWSLAAAFVLALGVQVMRTRRGSFDISAFACLALGLVAIAVAAIRLAGLLIPVTALLTASIASALLRETYESRSAQRESGHLLLALLEHVGAKPAPVPRTAGARLSALRRLQKSVLEEDMTRQALLEGMDEGVVLWNLEHEVVLSNPAAHRLWGDPRELTEIIGDLESMEPTVVSRGPRQLAVAVTDIEGGRLALIRDVSAERELEQRRREMQRLVSHELKTPLASIAGFGESLERYDLSGDEQRRVAALIRGEAQRLQEMVTVFLDLERLGGGHWEGAAQETDVGRLVDVRLDVLEAAAHARGLDLARSIGTGCRTMVVAALFERVIDNLVGNAIKYSEAGGTIDVSVRQGNERVQVLVRDQGPGIPDEHRARIFDRFFRVPGSSGTGAGLGLALVREVVDWHGGCITIDSERGAGSTFTVTLPAQKEA